MPELLVEQRTLSRPGRIAAGDPVDQGQPRRGNRRTARQTGRSVPAVPLPHHHELRQSLSEESQALRGDRRAEAEDCLAPDLTSCSRSLPSGFIARNKGEPFDIARVVEDVKTLHSAPG